MAKRVQDTLFAGAGEMRNACRALDWAQTPLGDSASWPQSLRTVAQLTLANPTPQVVLWGSELAQIYNDGYRTIMGTKHPCGLGQPTRECWPEVWHLNQPIYEQVLRGETLWFEDALFPITRTGTTTNAWFSLSYVPIIDESAGVAGILVAVSETTDGILAAQERERLRAALEVERLRLKETFRQAPSFMATFRGPLLLCDFVNEAYVELVGSRELLGRSLGDALPELRVQPFASALHGVWDSGEVWVARQTPLHLDRLGDGIAVTRYVDIIVLPLNEADGSRTGVVAHGSDVTERVLAQQSVEHLLVESESARLEAVVARGEAENARADAERARAAAESASRAKGEFLAIMSHELRTPLNAIGGYTELLEMGIRGPVNTTQRDDLRRIQASQQHLLGLINEVLDFAKLETETVEYYESDVVVNEALLAAETLVSPQVRAKGLTLTIDACPPGLMIRADAEKLRRLLVNLLSNAIKFTERSGHIDISCTADGSNIQFAVSDTGIGIDATQMERIFEPFVQVRADYTRTQEGTGLGLAISRKLARGMGGELEVASTIGEGATFTLTLPMSPSSM
ncbi:MAG: ATP-binding protein [Gemmatimonadota bacterium]